MRSARSALVGLGTLIILLTFVGFATFSPDGNEARPEATTDPAPAAITMAADAGATTGRVTAFVFANQLQSELQPEIQAELAITAPVERSDKPLSVTTTTQPPTTTTTTSAPPPPTTTTTMAPPDTTTTTTAPPDTTTTTTAPPDTTTTTTAPPASSPLTESEMRTLAAQHFPAEEVDKAVLVARCESNYDPAAYNPSGPFGGLYQHSLAYWDDRAASAGWAGASVYGADANTAVTAWLLARDGWGHWPYCSTWADLQLGG